jgi:predicted GIY-YIG superfamily endonuclease
MSNTRRAQPHVSVEATGVVYLLHFHERLGSERHYAQHYFGFTPDLESRVEKHRAGQGARITEVLKERGIGFDVVAVWPGNRQIENAIKLHSATRICPKCTPNPRIPMIIREAIEAEERRQARGTQQRAAAARARSAYQRGADLAERLIRDQVAAGRTAEQIAATHAYITGPGHQRAHSTQTQVETFRGYSEMVTAALAQLREDPQAPARPAPGRPPGPGKPSSRALPAPGRGGAWPNARTGCRKTPTARCPARGPPTRRSSPPG